MFDKLAIIGTAGRRDDARKISEKLYNCMFADLTDVIERYQVRHAVSGGAAVADHLAVRAFNEGVVSGLTLYLPADFVSGAFVPNPKIRFNPGETCNTYHRAFSAACSIDSLGEIQMAINNGAEVCVYHGFHMRNSQVAADCGSMVAYTFGNGSHNDFSPEDEAFTNPIKAGLKDGGTAHTWGECWKAKVKRHVNLYAFI